MAFEVVIRTLPVRLTEEEKRQKGQELAITLESIRVCKEDLAQIKLRYKKRLGDLETTQKALQQAVASGVEYREVDVAQRPNRVDGTVMLQRIDTGDIVASRAMTREEKEAAAQLELDDREERRTR